MSDTKKYDVAFSFASEDREFVRQVADILVGRHTRVFYDELEQIGLWGENLPEKLDQVYRFDSRYVVVYISEAYAAKMWTRFEVRSVMAKAMSSPTAYLLPARFDDTDLVGVHPTTAYIDLRKETPATFAEKILAKLHGKQSEVSSALFTDPQAFHILLLPFEAMEKAPGKEIKFERAILKRFMDLKAEHGLRLEAVFLQRGILPVSFDEGVAAGRAQQAHLVLWGDYYQQLENSTNVQLRWALVDVALPNVDKTGKTDILPVQSLSMISEGYLQHDVDYLIFWCLAHMELAQRAYHRALANFEAVAVKFSDKFQGIVKARMDHKGFSLTINRPAVQLLFYLGLCYDQQQRFDQAIACWSHILTGSAGEKGGNAFAWDSLGIAVSSGDQASVRGLLYVLLIRAKAYSAAGQNDAALSDYQRIYRYAKMAQSKPELWESVFRTVVEWLANELRIPEPTDKSPQSQEVLDKLRDAMQ